MRHLLLDANVVLRYLLQDDSKQGPAATKLFADAAAGRCRLEVDSLVIAECVYILYGHYRRDRNQTAFALDQLIQRAGVETPQLTLLRETLRRFSKAPIDFSDAWLAARGAMTESEVASFDRDLDRFTDICRFEPGRDSI